MSWNASTVLPADGPLRAETCLETHLSYSLKMALWGLKHVLQRIDRTPCRWPFESWNMSWNVSIVLPADGPLRAETCLETYRSYSLQMALWELKHVLKRIDRTPCWWPFESWNMSQWHTVSNKRAHQLIVLCATVTLLPRHEQNTVCNDQWLSETLNTVNEA